MKSLPGKTAEPKIQKNIAGESQFLSFVPKYIHFGEGHILKAFSQFLCFTFQILEAFYKLFISLFKCVFGVYLDKTRLVDQ